MSWFRSRRNRTLIAPAALLVAAVVVGALLLTGHFPGAASPAATPTPASGPPASTPTAEPPTSAPATSPSPHLVDRLEVPSLGISVPLVTEDCTEFSSAAAPSSEEALLAVCDPPTFYGIVAAHGGPLQPLASTDTAPAGTEIVVWDQNGFEMRWTLDHTVTTLEAFPDGSFPGHGFRPGQLLLQIRDGGRAVERFGTP